ncbi:hypothetical protein QJQ45_028288 [Haematococcus lacustris]|nr:hypothetical protein QJQ45_028288 [Haematococcus lacustris]
MGDLRPVKLFVGGLPPDIHEADLAQRFLTFGEPASVLIPSTSVNTLQPNSQENKNSRGFAYVTLTPKDTASVGRCLSLLAKPSFTERLQAEWEEDAANGRDTTVPLPNKRRRQLPKATTPEEEWEQWEWDGVPLPLDTSHPLTLVVSARRKRKCKALSGSSQKTLSQGRLQQAPRPCMAAVAAPSQYPLAPPAHLLELLPGQQLWAQWRQPPQQGQAANSSSSTRQLLAGRLGQHSQEKHGYLKVIKSIKTANLKAEAAAAAAAAAAAKRKTRGRATAPSTSSSAPPADLAVVEFGAEEEEGEREGAAGQGQGAGMHGVMSHGGSEGQAGGGGEDLDRFNSDSDSDLEGKGKAGAGGRQVQRDGRGAAGGGPGADREEGEQGKVEEEGEEEGEQEEGQQASLEEGEQEEEGGQEDEEALEEGGQEEEASEEGEQEEEGGQEEEGEQEEEEEEALEAGKKEVKQEEQAMEDGGEEEQSEGEDGGPELHEYARHHLSKATKVDKSMALSPSTCLPSPRTQLPVTRVALALSRALAPAAPAPAGTAPAGAAATGAAPAGALPRPTAKQLSTKALTPSKRRLLARFGSDSDSEELFQDVHSDDDHTAATGVARDHHSGGSSGDGGAWGRGRGRGGMNSRVGPGPGAVAPVNTQLLCPSRPPTPAGHASAARQAAAGHPPSHRHQARAPLEGAPQAAGGAPDAPAPITALTARAAAALVVEGRSEVKARRTSAASAAARAKAAPARLHLVAAGGGTAGLAAAEGVGQGSLTGQRQEARGPVLQALAQPGLVSSQAAASNAADTGQLSREAAAAAPEPGLDAGKGWEEGHQGSHQLVSKPGGMALGAGLGRVAAGAATPPPTQSLLQPSKPVAAASTFSFSFFGPAEPPTMAAGAATGAAGAAGASGQVLHSSTAAGSGRKVAPRPPIAPLAAASPGVQQHSSSRAPAQGLAPPADTPAHRPVPAPLSRGAAPLPTGSTAAVPQAGAAGTAPAAGLQGSRLSLQGSSGLGGVGLQFATSFMRNKGAVPTQPTKGTGNGKAKAVNPTAAWQVSGQGLQCSAQHAAQWGEQVAPLELCQWPGEQKLPAKDREYPELGNQWWRDRVQRPAAPKGDRQQFRGSHPHQPQGSGAEPTWVKWPVASENLGRS